MVDMFSDYAELNSQHTIFVSGIPENTYPTDLHNFFENKGYATKNVKILKNDGHWCAMVTLENNAFSILKQINKSPLTYNGKHLKIKLAREKTKHGSVVKINEPAKQGPNADITVEKIVTNIKIHDEKLVFSILSSAQYDSLREIGNSFQLENLEKLKTFPPQDSVFLCSNTAVDDRIGIKFFRGRPLQVLNKSCAIIELVDLGDVLKLKLEDCYIIPEAYKKYLPLREEFVPFNTDIIKPFGADFNMQSPST